MRDIEFASASAANLLPFHGRCHIAYMPSRGVVLGLSKFARLTGLFARWALAHASTPRKSPNVPLYELLSPDQAMSLSTSWLHSCRRFQDQQAFTDQILGALTGQLAPEGAAVLVEAKHMAEGPDAPMHLTSAAHGVFAEPNSTRATVRRPADVCRSCCAQANRLMC